MRLSVCAIGRLKRGPQVELARHYLERAIQVGRSIGIPSIDVVEFPESRASSVAERKSDEASRLLQSVPAEGLVIALDEGGRQFTSTGFAAELGRLRDAGTRDLAFLIGGADGHGADVLARAHLALSLGTLTLAHGLARIVLLEQIYRAFTIDAGHPYHRD